MSEIERMRGEIELLRQRLAQIEGAGQPEHMQAGRLESGLVESIPLVPKGLPDPTDHYEGEVLQLTADDGVTTDNPPVRAIDWGWLKMRVPA